MVYNLLCLITYLEIQELIGRAVLNKLTCVGRIPHQVDKDYMVYPESEPKEQ